MSHANAALTPLARLRLARLIVDDRWTPSTAARMFMVSPRTARKWADRYREEGKPGMLDRSSRPHNSPNKTSERAKRQIVGLRWRGVEDTRPVTVSDQTHVLEPDRRLLLRAEAGDDMAETQGPRCRPTRIGCSRSGFKCEVCRGGAP